MNVLHKMECECFAQNGDLGNTHPCTHTNSSLASCILVQLSDLCNLGFTVHVQYGITESVHVEGGRYRGVRRCISPPKFP